MCLRGDIFFTTVLDFCFLLDASFSEQVFFHCKGKQQFFEKEKLKAKQVTENSKSRKSKSEKASLSLSKSRKVERCLF